MLSAGLTTPLPASLTGDTRNVNKEEVIRRGTEALEALDTILGSGEWALGAA
jgi:metaxin